MAPRAAIPNGVNVQVSRQLWARFCNGNSGTRTCNRGDEPAPTGGPTGGDGRVKTTSWVRFPVLLYMSNSFQAHKSLLEQKPACLFSNSHKVVHFTPESGPLAQAGTRTRAWRRPRPGTRCARSHLGSRTRTGTLKGSKLWNRRVGRGDSSRGRRVTFLRQWRLSLPQGQREECSLMCFQAARPK